jgi:hypothetical protein
MRIDSIRPWKTRQQLGEIVRHQPKSVDISGTILRTRDGVTEQLPDAYKGLVARIPYGDKVVVKFKGKTYTFLQATDGTFVVL